MARSSLKSKSYKSRTAAAKAVSAKARNTIMANRRKLAMRPGGWINPIGGSELKYVDTNFTAGIVFSSATGASQLLNGTSIGSDATNRVGRQIKMQSLYLKCNVVLAPTTTGSSPIRIMVVYDPGANATAQVATDILLADALSSPNNLNNRNRFKTILDKTINCIGTAGPQSFTRNWYVKLGGLQTIYNAGSTSTVSDIQQGSLYLWVWQSGTLLVASPQQSFRTRLRFSDN